MPIKRGRKGKQWAASRSAGNSSSLAAAGSAAASSAATASAATERLDINDEDPTVAASDAPNEALKIGAEPPPLVLKDPPVGAGAASEERAGATTTTTSTTTLTLKNHEETKNPTSSSSTTTTTTTSPSRRPDRTPPTASNLLVLTSEKRRGMYECDYCYADISQLPRIRCATCPDFDLCLSCFATSDHTQTLRRLKAQASAHQAVGSSSSGDNNTDGDVADAVPTAAMLAGSGVSVAVLGHEASHGYRVCDSTRFPLFPTSRNLTLKGVVQSLEDRLNESTSTATTQAPATTAAVTGSDKKDSKEDASDDAMDVEEEPEAPNQPTATKDEAAKLSVANEGTQISTGSKEAGEGAPTAPGGAEESLATGGIESFTLVDDPRSIWTIEEDLRLLDGIKTHGLGNWGDVSEAVSGHGSVGKTPKRCMERYLDDYLGRYGHILPPYMLLEQDENASTAAAASASNSAVQSSTNSDAMPDDEPGKEGTVGQDRSTTPVVPEATTEIRASKRRSALLRSPSLSMTARKRFKAVPTESSPAMQNVWPRPFVPDGCVIGQEVGREQSYKAEQTFVKMISQLENQEKVEELRKEWAETKLFKSGGPTVLPMRPEDVATLPGAELVGYMPRRGDFDIEWENDAEQIVADMEFLPREPAQDQELKLKVLAIYNSKLEEREKRKRFVLSRKLYDYRSIQAEEQKLPHDERDLIHRMRLFERFHTPAEHKQFVDDLLKAKRLRKEIAKLQMYRRMGIRTLAEAEMYELDKSRRSFHKTTQQQKAAEAAKAAAAASIASSESVVAPAKLSDETVSSSLWRQYRTSDRKVRKSITRGLDSTVDDPNSPASDAVKLEANPEGDTDGKATSATPPPDEVQSGVPSTSQVEDASPMDVESSNPQPPLTAPPSEDTATEESAVQASTAPVDELATLPDYKFLSSREADLCRTLQLTPRQYLDVKRVLLHESLAQGLLDTSTTKRSVAMIDVERRGNVIDFMVRSGWISSTQSLGASSGGDPTDMST